MQFEIGMSTSRYLPASGTAGLERSFVSGNSRVPWPPPMMTQRTALVLSDWRPVCDISQMLRECNVVPRVRASNGFAPVEIVRLAFRVYAAGNGPITGAVPPELRTQLSPGCPGN